MFVRARSKSKKEEKYYRILETGKDLFMDDGIEGFSMRALARKLAMSKGNLYNYVQSKRELWFGIVSLEYEKFEDKLRKVAEKDFGSSVDKLVSIGVFFLDFCGEDYRRFQMMFLTPPPKSGKRGPIEEEFKYTNILGYIRELFQKAVENNEIKEKDTHSLTLFYWAHILGVAKVEANLAPMNLFMQNYFEETQSYSRKDFRDFFLNKTEINLRES